MKRMVLALLLLSSTGSAGSAKEAVSIRALLKTFGELNDQCRGGPGDNPNTLKACDKREAVARKLDAADWCYGKHRQAGYQMKWHKCTANSLRFGD